MGSQFGSAGQSGHFSAHNRATTRRAPQRKLLALLILLDFPSTQSQHVFADPRDDQPNRDNSLPDLGQRPNPPAIVRPGVNPTTLPEQNRSGSAPLAFSPTGDAALTFSGPNGTTTASANAQGNSLRMAHEAPGNWRGEVELLRDINSIKRDTRLKLAFQTLYDAARMGTYVSVEEGSTLEKFILAQGIKVDGGRFQVSLALLRKMVAVSFAESPLEFDTKLNQKALGIDYAKKFGGSLLDEIKTSLIYYAVDNKSLGTLNYLITDSATEFDQSRIDGGIRGGNKILLDVATTLRLSDTLKGEANLGIERLNYNAMFDTPASIKNQGAGGLGLTWQATRADRLGGKYQYSPTASDASLKYEHRFDSQVQATLEGGRKTYGNGILSEDYIKIGLGLTLDPLPKGSARAMPLFNPAPAVDKLTFADLAPNARIAGDQIQIMERLTWRQHEINIDKTKLGGSSYLEKNPNGTLKALNLDTGVSNLVAAAEVNYREHQGNFSIVGGRYIRIEKFETLHAPATYNISVLDRSGSYTLYTFDSQKGSVEFKFAPQQVNSVPANVAGAFIASTLHPTIRANLLTGTLAPNTVSQIVSGAISPALVNQYLAGKYSATVLNGVAAGKYSAAQIAQLEAGTLSSAEAENIANGVVTPPVAVTPPTTTTKAPVTVVTPPPVVDNSPPPAPADTTPPTTSVAPAVSGTSDTATTLSVTINEAGTGYYLVQAAAAAAPSVATVQASGTAFAMNANVAATPAISGLTASTAYKIYFVAKDSANNVQAAVSSVAVTTTAVPDTTPPVTTSAPAISVAATDTTASVTQTINENGTGYYLVQAAAAAAPTVAAVKAGTSLR